MEFLDTTVLLDTEDFDPIQGERLDGSFIKADRVGWRERLTHMIKRGADRLSGG